MAGAGKLSKAGKPLPASVNRVVLLAGVGALLALVFCIRTAQLALSLGQRHCSPPWHTAEGSKLKVAMVSLADSQKNINTSDTSTKRNKRDFGGVLEMTRPNKEAYAKKHNYDYIDASALLNVSRPASWSKILAVQHYLPNYDWVFWVDADTLVTNPDQPLEALLPAGDSPDFLLTKDGGGYNAGVWIIRNSTWSSEFLTTWWSMESFVRTKPGDTKSGDNDALKHYLANMRMEEFERHVSVAPQCAFNSYLWKPSFNNWVRYLAHPADVTAGLYRNGDFLLHLAGWDNKVAYIQQFMQKTATSRKLLRQR